MTMIKTIRVLKKPTEFINPALDDGILPPPVKRPCSKVPRKCFPINVIINSSMCKSQI